MAGERVAFLPGAPPLVRAQGAQRKRGRGATCAPRMLEQNTIIAVATALVGVGGGIGLVAWTEQQGERGAVRENKQKCTECGGATRVVCNICQGSGKDPLAERDPTRTGPCTYCEGQTTIRCFNCNGSGIQPRFLDRLSPEDFMD